MNVFGDIRGLWIRLSGLLFLTLAGCNDIDINFVPDPVPSIAIEKPANLTFVNLATDSTSYEIEGTCSEPGQQVSVYIDDTQVGSAMCENARFSTTIDTTQLDEGSFEVKARITNPAGKTSTSEPLGLNKDVTAPVLAIESPEAGTYITSATQINFNLQGSCSEAGQNLFIEFGDGVNSVSRSVLCASGSNRWELSLDASSLKESSTSELQIKAIHRDLAGNSFMSTRSFNKITRVDAPVISGPTPTSAFNSNSSDLTIIGDCITGHVVTLQGSASDTATCSSSAFSFSLSIAQEGTYNFTTTQRDSFGNVSPPSNTFTWNRVGAASRLSLSLASNVDLDTCTVMTVSVLDANNLSTVLLSPRIVSLSGAGNGGAFFADDQCSTPLSTVEIAALTGSREFYFKTSKADPRTFKASAAGLISAILNPSINPGSRASELIFALSPGYGLINQPFAPPPVVLIVDERGNLVTSGPDASAAVTLSLKAGSTGTLSGLATVVAVNGVADFTDSNLSVDLRGEKVLTALKPDLSGSGGSGILSKDSSTFLIDSIAYKWTYSELPPFISAGQCSSAFTLQARDSSDVDTVLQSNLVVNLSGAGSGAFYSDDNCMNPITSLNIPIGQGTVQFYYRSNTRGEGINLSSSSNGLVAAIVSYTVATPSPAKLHLSGPASQGQGVCGSYTISTRNESDINTPVSQNVTVSLVGAGLGSFYSDFGCTNPITTATINAASHSATIYYKGAFVESVTLGANATALDPTTLGVSITSMAMASFALTGPTVATTDCSGPWTVTAKDASNNTLAVGADTLINLSGKGLGTFYTAAGCAISTDTITINAGTSTAQFFYRGYGDEITRFSVIDAAQLAAGSSLLVTVSSVIISSSSNDEVHCSVLSSGRLVCAGRNHQGLLGLGIADTNHRILIPKTVIASGVSKVKVSFDHACAVMSNGTISCWGNNGSGRLGNGNSTNQHSPVLVSGITNAIDVAPQRYATCAVLSTGAARCWGQGSWNNLGLNNWSGSQTPVVVSNVSTAVEIVSAEYSSCVRLSGGQVTCWGYNSPSLGNSDSYIHNPSNISGLTGVGSLAASSSNYCARLSAGGVKCWGRGDLGGIGNGSTSHANTPTNVSSISTAAEINSDLNSIHFCVRLSDNSIRCWGHPGNGRSLGVAQSTSQSNTPITPTGFTGTVAKLGAQSYSSNCLLMSGGGEKCIGSNSNGTLGDGTTSTPTSSFVNTRFDIRFLDIAGPSLIAKDTCMAFTIRNLVSDVAQPFAVTTSISLSSTRNSGSGTLSFYDDASCAGATVTSKTVLAGESGKAIFVKTLGGPATYTLISSATGFAPSSSSLTVTGVPAGFRLSSTLTTAAVGQCVPLSISVFDSSNTNLVALISPLSLNLFATNLIAENKGSFHSHPQCDSSPLTQVTLNAGQSQSTVYYKNSGYEVVNIEAHDNQALLTNLGGGSIDFGGVNNWYEYPIIYGGGFLVTGLCHRILYNKTNRSSDMLWEKDEFTVAGNNQNFYSDENCSVPTSTFTLSKDYESAFYIKSDVDSQNWWDSYLSFSSVYANNPNYSISLGSAQTLEAFIFAGNNSAAAGDCIGIDLTSNFWGNRMGLIGPINMDYQSSSSGGAFYKDGNCTQPMSSGYSELYYNYDWGYYFGRVYYKDTDSGSPTLSFVQNGVTYASLSLTISGPSSHPTQLQIVGSGSVSSGVCEEFSVEIQNGSGSPVNAVFDMTLQLQGAGTGKFYSDNACSSPMNSWTHPRGLSSSKFYFKGKLPESLNFRVSNSFLLSDTHSLSVSVGSDPTHLVWSGPATGATDECLEFQIEARNALDLVANTDKNILVNFVGLGFGKIFSDPGCTTQITSQTMSIGTSSFSFYLKNSVAQSLEMVARASELASGSHNLTLNSPSGYSLSLVGPDSFEQRVCVGPYTVQALDAQNESYPVVADQSIGFETNSSLQVFEEEGCATPISQRTMASGENHIQFWVRDNNAQLSSVIVTNQTSTNWSAGALELSSLPPLVKDIKVSSNFSCALWSDGALRCWGNNSSGRLGNASTSNSEVPVLVSGMSSGVESFVLGNGHACALMMTGGVKCWGNNGNGQLGDSSTTARTSPVDVVGLGSGVKQIASASDSQHTCALLNSGAVKCWGLNNAGSLGDDSVTQRSSPVDVVGLGAGVERIAVGGSNTCAVMTSGDLKCWGSQGNFMYGNGAGANVDSRVPKDIALSLGDRIKDVALSGSHRCALLQSGAMRCWGANGHGQLGNGSTNTGFTMGAVTGLEASVASIAIGNSYSCAVLNSGELRCWGYNLNGQLGIGHAKNIFSPTTVMSNVTKIASSSSSTCVITQDDSLKCFGQNSSANIGFSLSNDVNALSPQERRFFSRSLKASWAGVLQIGECTPLNISTLLNGTTSIFHRATTLSLSTNAPGLQFFADPYCAEAVSSVSASAGASNVFVYVRADQVFDEKNIRIDGDSLNGELLDKITLSDLGGLANGFSPPSSYFQVLAGSCTPVVFQYYDSSSLPARPLDQSHQIRINLNYSSGSYSMGFFSDPDCSNYINNNMVVASGKNAFVFYIMDNNLGYTSVEVHDTQLGQSSYLDVEVGDEMSSVSLSLDMPTNVRWGQCSQVDLNLSQSVGFDSYFNIYSNYGYVNYYSDPGCSLGTSQIYVPAGATQGTVYMAAAGDTSGEQVYAEYAANYNVNTYFDLNQIGWADYWISMTQGEDPGTGCIPVSIDANQSVAYDTYFYTYSTDTAQIYSDVDCTNTSSAILMGAGQSATTFYIQGATPGEYIYTNDGYNGSLSSGYSAP